MAESPSSKISAIEIKTIAHTKLITRASFKLVFLPNQSATVDEDNELIDELNVDIAAESTPANNTPLNPIGK